MTSTHCWREIGVFGGDQSCPELLAHIHCRSCPIFTAAGRALLDRPLPAQARRDATQNMAAPAPTRRPTTAVLVFRISKEWFAMSISSLIELSEVRPVHRIPHRSQACLAGLVNVRGQLHLCASFHGLLRLEGQNERTPKARIVHFGHGSAQWTFIADEVRGIADIENDTIFPPPSTIALAIDDACSGSFHHDGLSVALLHPGKVCAILKREVG